MNPIQAYWKLLLACCFLACYPACSPSPPDRLLRPELLSVGETAGYDSVELTATFSRAGSISSASFEIMPEKGGTIRIPATITGDAAHAVCRSLEPGETYAYTVFFSNGRDEVSSGPYRFMTLERPFDPALLARLLADFDADRDGVMSPEELQVVRELNLSDIHMESQDGLERLVNLERLSMGTNGLRRLDLTANKKLEFLSAGGDPLLEEIILDNPALLSVYLFGDAGIRSLDFSRCPFLYICQLYGLRLETVDFSGNPDLYTLRFSGTALKELDLSHNWKFRHLESVGNDALETVWLPDGLVLESCEIGENTRIKYK